LNKLKSSDVSLPEHRGKHAEGIPLARQQGVWSMLLARQLKVIFDQGAQTIKSG